MWFYTLLFFPIHLGVVHLIWNRLVGDGGTGKTTYVKVRDIVVQKTLDRNLIFELYSVTRLVNLKRSISVCAMSSVISLLIAWSTHGSNRRC